MSNIKSVKEVGAFQTYDLEVDHPDHQFYLSNGILTSNSHSTLYSMTSYKTAYFKAHYPVEFLMANLMAEVKSNTPDAKGNIEKIKKELRKHRVKILPPDINKSQLVYTIEDGNKLITGLDAIKYVGDEAIKDIIEKRPFKNFFDFMVRVSSKTVRSNNIQALAACGALDSFGLSRKSIFLYCSDYRKKLQIWLKKHNPDIEQFIYPYPNEASWTEAELYALEQYYLGESFICRPAVAYGKFFMDEHNTVTDIKKAENKTNIYSVKGIIKDFFEFKVKKETSKYYGQSMLKATFEDKNGDQCLLTVFPDRYETMRNRIKEINRKAEFDIGIALHFSGNTNNYEDNMGIILDKLFNISMAPAIPADLTAKKVNLKEAKAIKQLSNEDKQRTPEEILDQLEDNLYDQGLIDLDNDDEDD
jgi:DNA polymerase-3 subunit alpha